MNFVPVLIISLILLIITILLAIADHLLVSYGECKVTVHQEGEAKEFTVQGGSFLLTDLTSKGINITSSCAGKASCGYCKIKLVSGGGQILPTEEIFMSREEKHSGMRLACQVKVKDDLEIHIPDYLETVRGIVKNKSYDAKLRWQFIKNEQLSVTSERPIVKLAKDDRDKVCEIVEEYKDVPGAIVPVLQRIDSTFNYLPEPVLRLTAKAIDMPLSEVHRVATFYNAFSLEPKGKNIIRVCMGTSCYVKGGRRILQTVQNKLGIKVGEHTEDLRFSLETVSCIGCCGQSPVISVNDEIYGYFRVNMIDDVLHKFY
jgi:NADH:ubiquinone oxidoreductase subunit E/ferredoxin